MLAIQMRTFVQGDKELARVRIRSSVRHGQQPSLVQRYAQIFIRERRSVDAFPARPVPCGIIPGLEHETVDHAVEDRVLVMHRHVGR